MKYRYNFKYMNSKYPRYSEFYDKTGLHWQLDFHNYLEFVRVEGEDLIFIIVEEEYAKAYNDFDPAPANEQYLRQLLNEDIETK